MAKYPFHPQTRRHVHKLGLDIGDLASLDKVVDRAKERIAATFEVQVNTGLQVPFRETEVEIFSFNVAVLVVTGVKDKMLTERFALSEAQRVFSYLHDEKDEVILEFAKHFEWDINPSNVSPYPFSIHFVNYLNNVSRGRLVHAPKWKLVNRQLHGGQVFITKREARRLLQEEVMKYIEDIVYRESKERITKRPKNIQTIVDEIKAKFIAMKPHFADFDPLIKAEESEYPPCIRSLLARTAEGKHLSHTERFTLVTYLLHQGISIDDIVNLFSNIADFREKLARYQVEHLAGQRGSRQVYVTYNCSTLQTHHVCFEPDQICETIRNPLTYHLRKKSNSKK